MSAERVTETIDIEYLIRTDVRKRVNQIVILAHDLIDNENASYNQQLSRLIEIRQQINYLSLNFESIQLDKELEALFIEIDNQLLVFAESRLNQMEIYSQAYQYLENSDRELMMNEQQLYVLTSVCIKILKKLATLVRQKISQDRYLFEITTLGCLLTSSFVGEV